MHILLGIVVSDGGAPDVKSVFMQNQEIFTGTEKV